MTERLMTVAVMPLWLCSAAGFLTFALPQLAWKQVLR